MKFFPFFRNGLAALVLLSSSSSGLAQSFSSLMASGDQQDHLFKPTEALRYYLPAEKLEPKNPHLLVRIARQYRHLMAEATTNEEKLRLGYIALEYGKRAAAHGPKDSDAQLSCAITYGRLLPLQGSKDQVTATPLIKDGADRAIALNPRNDMAWHVLGRWHQVLAQVGGVKRALGGLLYGKLPTTTNDEAVRCFEEAIKINPKRPRHYIELGRTYAQMGKDADAKTFIQKGLAMPDMDQDDAELKARGRDALAKLP